MSRVRLVVIAGVVAAAPWLVGCASGDAAGPTGPVVGTVDATSTPDDRWLSRAEFIDLAGWPDATQRDVICALWRQGPAGMAATYHGVVQTLEEEDLPSGLGAVTLYEYMQDSRACGPVYGEGVSDELLDYMELVPRSGL